MSASRRVTAAGLAGVLLVVPAACGDDDNGASSDSTSGTTDAAAGDRVVLVAYDSLPVADTTLNDALGAFTDDTGIDVEIVTGGDTGTMVSKAVLTAGNPEGDVMWGVDNTFLSRAVDGEVFEPYRPQAADALSDDLVATVPDEMVVPVDFGDVCVNYDIGWFDEHELDPPATFDDLLLPEYADLLVVENPATSSPGLAFVLATIDEYGDDGWRDYWTALADNGVEVVDGWTEAYYERSTWAGGGPRPLVVSYGSSPPAEVVFADPPVDAAPTGVVEATCFRQVEYAGILRGTPRRAAAERLVDFLLSVDFQRELPLNLFVYPANAEVELPPEFVEFAVVPEDPHTIDPDDIDANRADWIDQWTSIVLD